MNGTKRICSAAAVVLAASMAPAAFAQSALQRLPELNVDPSQVSVSGLGWGGAMAIQVGVAHSSRIMGVAAFAAFPYDCERRGGVTPRLCAGLEGPDVIGLVANARAWFGHEIDAQEHLRRQRIFLYAGVNDVTIGPQVVAATHAFYQALIPAENIFFDPNGPGGHFLPMDYYDPRSTYWPCQTATSPRNWPVDCAYDGAGKSLAWIYGDLAPRTASLDPGGDLIKVNQGEFVARDFGMDDIAFLYVPKACAPGGSVCRLHVFLHDRDQSFFARNDTVFAERSGYTRWAETNRIVLLFPQTYPDPNNNNPLGYWDTEGRYDAQFDQKGGVQVEAIMAMVKRLTGGFQGYPAVEYYHAGYDHYVLVAQADEMAKLDDGTFAGWARTGESFLVYPLDAPGTSSVCRFYTEAFPPSSSHFYTPVASECEIRKSDPKWQYEGLRFALRLPDAQGDCEAGTRPLYRLYNDGQGGAPNHRYVTSFAQRDAMLARKWVAEGSGVGVIGCVPL